MSDSVRPHRRQPTLLRHPWDSPGKNTGVGCHFLLQSMKVKSESEVTQPCPTVRDPMDCSPPGSPVHGIFQARILEWGPVLFFNKGTFHCPVFTVLFSNFLFKGLDRRILGRSFGTFPLSWKDHFICVSLSGLLVLY